MFFIYVSLPLKRNFNRERNDKARFYFVEDVQTGELLFQCFNNVFCSFFFFFFLSYSEIPRLIMEPPVYEAERVFPRTVKRKVIRAANGGCSVKNISSHPFIPFIAAGHSIRNIKSCTFSSNAKIAEWIKSKTEVR